MRLLLFQYDPLSMYFFTQWRYYSPIPSGKKYHPHYALDIISTTHPYQVHRPNFKPYSKSMHYQNTFPLSYKYKLIKWLFHIMLYLLILLTYANFFCLLLLTFSPLLADINNGNSVLRMISEVAQKNDFVAFKLDIDNSETGNPPGASRIYMYLINNAYFINLL